MSDAGLPAPEATGPYRPARPAVPPERFPAGTLLAGRYRVVAALGKGGMGEVYRADDLTLGQPVALKFLPTHLATDPDRLARFRGEVAAARKVSHPNVCRVYDIAEHEGQPFLTMEFVDGEDLSSVLKRLGRMTEEKGAEVARQLCSALAAVHDQGLLHRDLKPANVMLDGRGRVRLTDFGLAAAAEGLSGAEVRSGTPQYQAPEQRAGREVTVRSDLYALGLVLYEVFTGRRAFPTDDRAAPPSKPSSHIGGLNPAVEQAILKCLEPDPADRPRSVNAVLARLPGGDPLAAAVAAGETPSPQLVADADAEDGRLRPWVAAALVGAIVSAVLVHGWLTGYLRVSARVPLRDAEPALMRFKAREALAALGHDEPAGDTALRYLTDTDYIRFVQREGPRPDRWDGRWADLGDGRPPAMVVVYRAARRGLAAADLIREPGVVYPLAPPATEPGMVDVLLDLRGRLLRFSKVADLVAPDEPEKPAAADWRPAFAAAGLSWEAFAANPTRPRHRPPLAADVRFAWVGPYPHPRVGSVRVEAASLGGSPVYFAVEFPWQKEGRAVEFRMFEPDRPDPGAQLVFLGLPVVAIGLAWWNWRAGRADLRGAGILGGVVFVTSFARWLLTMNHVPDSREVGLLIKALGQASYNGGSAAVFYLAFEPFIRKRWPWQMVAWSRLLAGRVRDALVARDVLIGLVAGAGSAVLLAHDRVGPVWAPDLTTLWPTNDAELSPAVVLLRPIHAACVVALMFFFFFFLVHWACRNRWLAAVVTVALNIALFQLWNQPKPLIATLTAVAIIGMMQWLTLRYGVLAFVVEFCTFWSLLFSGWSFDVGAWFAVGPNLFVAALLALTLYAGYTATEGRLLGTGGTED